MTKCHSATVPQYKIRVYDRHGNTSYFVPQLSHEALLKLSTVAKVKEYKGEVADEKGKVVLNVFSPEGVVCKREGNLMYLEYEGNTIWSIEVTY